MKKLFSPTIMGILIGLLVAVVFVWSYTLLTTSVGAHRPLRATEADLAEKVQTYLNENVPEPGTFSLPETPQPGEPCSFLYGVYTEGETQFPYICVVARQIFSDDYLIGTDLMGFARGGEAMQDGIWRGSGELSTVGYVFTKYTAHYAIDENGAAVTYERHIKFLDLISVCLLFTIADFVGKNAWAARLKKLAEKKAQ